MSTPVTAQPAAAGRRALLADGSAVWLRRLGHRDRPVVEQLHHDLPRDDRYLRFFTLSRTGERAVADVIVADDAVAVGAFSSETLLGVAHYRREPSGADPEIAVVVARTEQHHGVASLLLEYLVSVARAEGVQRLVADVLSINHGMLQVIRDSGLRWSSSGPEDGVCHLLLDLAAVLGGGPGTEHYLQAVQAREAGAAVASLRPVLAPRSVVVIGAGHRPGSVGRIVLRQIITGGFTGAVHTVNPPTTTAVDAAVAGVTCHRAVTDLPGDIDLAVLCVPAAAVPQVAEQCGRRGVRALLVITSGVTADPVLAAGLRAAVERHGMRLVGPNCLGLVNTDPQVRLQATFSRPIAAGQVGLATQSGGVAIALMAELDRLGLGVSTAVSTGDAVDINGDDLLLWWAQDGSTRAAVLYVEALRRPRQFARLARQLAHRIPVLSIRSCTAPQPRSAPGTPPVGRWP